jgi:chromate reductase
MRMQLELRLTLQSVGTNTMPKPEIVITHCKDKFDAEGRLTDETTREHLRRFLVAFLEWTRRF